MAKVRQTTGLLAYLERRLGSFRGGGRETEWFCPFCIDRLGDESASRKLYVNVVKGKAYCFKCDYKASNLAQMFRDMNGGALRYEELEILKGEVRIPHASVRDSVLLVLYEDDADEVLKPQELPEHVRWLTQCQWEDVALQPVYRYLERRGVDEAKM